MAGVMMEERLAGIRDILGSLVHPQDKVKGALEDLGQVLLEFIRSSDSEIRNLCFSMGIAKATLGILRSCKHASQVGMVAMAARCLALLAHDNEEARSQLGEMGVLTNLINLLVPPPQRSRSDNSRGMVSGRQAKGSSHMDGASSGRQGRSEAMVGLWPREWLQVYEQVMMCLRKMTFHNHSNQQEMARVGGIKLVVEMVMDLPLSTNYGDFPPKARLCLEELVLNKKLISRVVSVPDEEKEALFCVFPAVQAKHYPAFYLELVREDGEWVSSAMLERGVVWPEPSPPKPTNAKWTCVAVQWVEDGCHVWCQFCSQKPNEAVVRARNSLRELVSKLAL